MAGLQYVTVSVIPPIRFMEYPVLGDELLHEWLYRDDGSAIPSLGMNYGGFYGHGVAQ